MTTAIAAVPARLQQFGARLLPKNWSRERWNFVLTAALLLVVFPLTLSSFRLGMIAKYLTYAFPAVGLVLCWGNAGILSLGQGVFFGLGGYSMAMFLKLEASDKVSTAIQSTPGIPDFMDWNQLTELPFFWRPFENLGFALCAVGLVPGLLALGIGLLAVRPVRGPVLVGAVRPSESAARTLPHCRRCSFEFSRRQRLAPTPPGVC